MIRVFEPLLGKTEKKFINKSLNNGYVSSSGPSVIQFEKKWAQYCDRKYGVSVSNGTVALQLALKILNLNKGDEVIMPSNTIISCAMAAVYNDLKIVPIDCKLDDWCIDENLIEKKINNRTKAILFVNIFGHPCDIDKIKKIAKKYNLYVIEDAAESHGSKYKNKICGSFGDISTFSFYANKLITTGEGGMLVMNNKKLYQKALFYRNLCFNNSQRFKHYDLGFNFRFTNLQADLGLAQMTKIDFLIKKKIQIAKQYIYEFRNQNFFSFVNDKSWAFNTYWMFGIVIKNKKITAKSLIKKLKKFEIETRPFFFGLHKQPILKNKYIKKNNCPNTDYISKYGLYLPTGYNLDKKKIKKISKITLEIFKKLK
jgi:perosamine synthetase